MEGSEAAVGSCGSSTWADRSASGQQQQQLQQVLHRRPGLVALVGAWLGSAWGGPALLCWLPTPTPPAWPGQHIGAAAATEASPRTPHPASCRCRRCCLPCCLPCSQVHPGLGAAQGGALVPPVQAALHPPPQLPQISTARSRSSWLSAGGRAASWLRWACAAGGRVAGQRWWACTASLGAARGGFALRGGVPCMQDGYTGGGTSGSAT